VAQDETFDAVIVGAGFAGLYMLHKLRGLGLRAVVLEAGEGVGGTWYWNRYPGARCDVESLQYSYSFCEALQQEWDWTERYAGQPEILTYAEHVARRFDLLRDIRFGRRVVAIHWQDDDDRWRLETEGGEAWCGRFAIMATGCLSVPNTPRIDGLDDFGGPVYHTGRWPREKVDFTGLTVGIIGTGSSAIQSIPIIARQAAELTVFQRTANFVVPSHNRPLDAGEQAAIKADYASLRERARTKRSYIDYTFNDHKAVEVTDAERAAEYEARWAQGGLAFNGCFADHLTDARANDYAKAFLHAKVKAVVADPETAELLCSTSVVGCKRLCVDTGYFETFNQSHVHLVDVSETPIARIAREGPVVGGTTHPVDALVLATGFDAMTGALLRMNIRGRDGRSLEDAWAEGPRSYLGLAVAGFPNLFTITGPGSPSVLSNMLMSIEQHVEWIGDCLAALARGGYRHIEAAPEAQDAWVAHVGGLAAKTLYPTCNSWYLGANVPGKPRVFMPYIGCPPYRSECEAIAANGYAGFARR
jgi:cyclohexanone monooxygenase